MSPAVLPLRRRRIFTGWRTLCLVPLLWPFGCKETQSSSPVDNPVSITKATPSVADALPDQALRTRMAEAVKARGSNYRPRTRHTNADGLPKFTNRLIFESSPYLQQHAHNPVNWMPWGPEAFALAQALGRPIFLSVGYSTCHWCHVMEEESFEDEEIAQTINDHYIPIKVDREERPDVDALYMTAVQMLTGRGGWPMSVWLTPDKLPFFGGTYFPARTGNRGSRMGFLSLLRNHARDFREDPATVGNRAQQLMQRISENEKRPPSRRPSPAAAVTRAVSAATQGYDSSHGGMRRAPKFPSSFPIQLLLRDYATRGDEHSLTMATETLRHMAAGGIYDHVGGGFHRYSTDARWLVPHFEKMLYDNALLSVAYLEAYQATDNRDFATVARETFDYILREMTSPEGGFYSATDADSLTPGGKREEGYYFTWTPEELKLALSKEEVALITKHYQVSDQGNFEGRSILHAATSRAEAARASGMTALRFDRQLDTALAKLRTVRRTRPAPLRDDKLQVSWNGLMLGALAQGGLILSEPRYVKAATRAADFLLGQLRPNNQLRHSFTDGKVSDSAFLDDYTFFTAGLLDLFEATGKPRFLSAALELMTTVEERFADSGQGGYFATADNRSDELLLRQKPRSDRAIPNGNSYAVMNQLRLHALTTQDAWRRRAETTLAAFGSDLSRNPMSLDVMLLGLQYSAARSRQVVLIMPPDVNPLPTAMEKVLFRTFAPHKVALRGTAAHWQAGSSKNAPWASDKPTRRGLPTAYVCEQGSCELPTTDPAVFARQLAAIH